MLALKGADLAPAAAEDEARKTGSIGECSQSSSHSIEQIQDSPIDPRLGFLARAATRHDLVKRDEYPLEQAFDELKPAFSEIAGYPVCSVCGSQPCVNPSFCDACRKGDRLRKPPSAEVKFLRSMMRDEVSLAAAIAQIERRRGRR